MRHRFTGLPGGRRVTNPGGASKGGRRRGVGAGPARDNASVGQNATGQAVAEAQVPARSAGRDAIETARTIAAFARFSAHRFFMTSTLVVHRPSNYQLSPHSYAANSIVSMSIAVRIRAVSSAGAETTQPPAEGPCPSLRGSSATTLHLTDQGHLRSLPECVAPKGQRPAS
jgi:hypothetical protein